MPGYMVYEYHYILLDTGRIYHTKGKSYPSDMISGGCIFIDYANGYMRINHKVAINTTKNVKDKINFEREDQSQGVVVKGYYT